MMQSFLYPLLPLLPLLRSWVDIDVLDDGQREQRSQFGWSWGGINPHTLPAHTSKPLPRSIIGYISTILPFPYPSPTPNHDPFLSRKATLAGSLKLAQNILFSGATSLTSVISTSSSASMISYSR